MENISISWYHIPELVVPIRISLIEECCQQGIYWTNGSVWLSWSLHFESFTVATMTLFLPLWNICVTNDHEYVPHAWPITGLVTRLTRRVPLVEQTLLTLPIHIHSPPGFSEVRVTRSLVLCVSFVDRYLSYCPFSFGHCVVCPSSSYGFWLPHVYLQTRLISTMKCTRPVTFLDWHRYLKNWHV
jgi:hypothetical protein